jgi:LytR cell envelope-related transcriptional attenuator
MTDFIDVLEQQLVSAHRGRGRRLFAVPWRTTIVFAGAVAVAAAVVVAVLALSSPAPHHPESPAAHRTASPPAHGAQTKPADRVASPPVPFERARVPLAVLNGTTVTGLARGAADKLTTKGYNEPNVVTNDTTNQQRPTTQVFYEAKARAAALDVAKILGVPTAQVKPMDANARALADRAEVAVFMGADKAR